MKEKAKPKKSGTQPAGKLPAEKKTTEKKKVEKKPPAPKKAEKTTTPKPEVVAKATPPVKEKSTAKKTVEKTPKAEPQKTTPPKTAPQKTVAKTTVEKKSNGIVVVEGNTGAQPPLKIGKVKVRKPADSAGGFEAIRSALGHAGTYMRLSDANKTMFKVNQMGGFDCPGCAWPDPDDDRSKLGEYCENGIKAIAEEAQKKKVTADFFAQHSIKDLQGWSDFELGKAGRLAEPMWRAAGDDHYRPITWDAAFQLIGKELNQLASPDEAIFYTSGRTSNEAAFLYQLFAREFGTNNLPDCSNMCHESTSFALNSVLGIGKGTVTLDDFEAADLIIIMGQNPGTNHPRMLTALEKCKEKGGKILAINPLKEAGLIKFKNPQRIKKMLGSGTELADLYLQVKINGDVALLKAIMSLLLYEEKKRLGSIFDMDFVLEKTEGYEAFAEHLQTFDFNDLENACGIKRSEIKKAAKLIQKSNKIIACWAMGLTQHENGVDNVQEIVNLLLLKGSIGKPGAGLCPVRGHSNVQGDRTMGIWENPKKEFLDQLQQVFGFNPPRKKGHSTVEAIQAMYQGQAKVFFAMGGNFVSAAPDTEVTAKALRQCRLTAHVSTKLNRSHLIPGQQALILPCLGRTDKDWQNGQEQFVSTENSMGVVQSSQGVLKPCSDLLLSEPAIVAGIAQATLGARSKVDWAGMTENYDLIRDRIAEVIPGFDDYNKKVREPAGFYLPNGPRERDFSKAKGGKAQFTLNKLPQWNLAADQYLMMTIRSHDQFNTTIYGLDDRYRGIYRDRRVVMMNRKDMDAAQIKPGQWVDLVSEYDGQTRIAPKFMAVAYDIPQQCIATYFPEANVLVPVTQFARGSKTPISKSVIVKVKI